MIGRKMFCSDSQHPIGAQQKMLDFDWEILLLGSFSGDFEIMNIFHFQKNCMACKTNDFLKNWELEATVKLH